MNQSKIRRTRHDMIFGLLTGFLTDGKSMTSIMAHANINPRDRKTILQFVIRKTLIRLINKPEMTKRQMSFYEVTDKGQQFLKSYSELQVMLE